jgi:hypothetical protein
MRRRPKLCRRPALSICGDSSHILDMAKSPEKDAPPRAANDDRSGKPKRRSPLTDFMDAAEPLHPRGFSEAPQAELSGVPLKGSVSDWANEIAREVDKGLRPSSPLAGEVSAERTEGGGDEVLGSGLSSPADSLPARGRERFRALTRPLRLDALDTLLLGPAEAAEYRRMAGVAASVVGAPATAPALPFSVDDLYWCFRQLQAYEAWATQGGWISAKDRGLGPGVRERFEFGSTLDAGIAAAETRRRDAFRDALAGLLGNDGVIVMPTVPGAAPLNASSHDELQAYRERALRLLCLSGLSGFPQITLPLGSLDGAPFGISLLGPKDSDLALIRLGREIMATAQNTK